VNLLVTPEIEAMYGKAVVEAAKHAGVRHFVYSSETGATQPTRLGYLESKQQIESRIHELGIPATILRHAFFLEWLKGSTAPIMWSGLSKSLGQNDIIQIITLDDVGAFAALVFDHPKQFIGKEIEIAADEVYFDQLVQAYRRVEGKNPPRSLIPYWLLTRMGNFGKFIQHLHTQESRANIAALQKLYPDLKNLEQGLRIAKPMLAPSAPSKNGKS
jgi:uncharacterized protein YbjT (DUF2867 family)